MKIHGSKRVALTGASLMLAGVVVFVIGWVLGNPGTNGGIWLALWPPAGLLIGVGGILAISETGAIFKH